MNPLAPYVERITEATQGIQAAKTAIASAITAKGGTVAAADGLADFATAIAAIPSGGADYLQHATNLANAFSGAYFNEDNVELNMSNNTTLLDTFYVATGSSHASIGVKNLTLNIGNGKLTTIQEAFRGNTVDLESITFEGTFSDTLPSAFITSAFRGCRVLKKILGEPLPRLAGSTTWMQCYALEDVRFQPSCAATNADFADCSALTDDTLISIANALAGIYTLKLNATPKARLDSIMGTVTGGVFSKSASGTISLEDFIAVTKGWTIA